MVPLEQTSSFQFNEHVLTVSQRYNAINYVTTNNKNHCTELTNCILYKINNTRNLKNLKN